MFNISFSPMRLDHQLEASVSGDVLTVNGESFDFSALPEGALLPQEAVDCAMLVSEVARDGAAIHLTLILPHGAEAPQETRFPQPITASDGPVALPPYEIEEVTQ